MTNTDKAVCREISSLLVEHGIEDVILSPGSRNAPLIMAVTRNSALRHRVVVDERCAAFVALGLASRTRRPVAIICTSGTALLNYAPAVAEAFYREIPLIVISADRPQEWIDQDDSQTIRQFGALDKIVKSSWNIPVENGDATQLWMVNRLLNDALADAATGRRGPVHINVQLDVPLTRQSRADNRHIPRRIDIVTRPPMLTTVQARSLGSELAPPQKVLVIAGFMMPDARFNKAMKRLALIPNVAVLHEAQANLHGLDVFGHIDRILSAMTEAEKHDLLPDTVITVGGSLVSRFVKSWLRGTPGIKHWHVGERGQSVDCFKCLSKRIELPAESFMPQLASAMQPYAKSDCDYNRQWTALARRAAEQFNNYARTAPWCDMTAMHRLMRQMPDTANLQAGNGTAVRYVQLCDYGHIHRIDSNRGVSGIDGCTSTAIGAALDYKHLTILITGDMSAQYDLGALAINCIPPSFRMAVLNNGGGGIFRFIESTAALDELDECFVADVRLPLKQLAAGFGFDYLHAASPDELDSVLPRFFGQSDRPVILDIETDGKLSADILRGYFRNNVEQSLKQS